MNFYELAVDPKESKRFKKENISNKSKKFWNEPKRFWKISKDSKGSKWKSSDYLNGFQYSWDSKKLMSLAPRFPLNS